MNNSMMFLFTTFLREFLHLMDIQYLKSKRTTTQHVLLTIQP